MKSILGVLTIASLIQATPTMACDQVHERTHHEMQHGFVLADDDKFASHLVATGHHSRQTEILGELVIEDAAENETYKIRKSLNSPKQVYFLFQAQKLDLPSLAAGQVLSGHMVESQIGKYDSKNIIVRSAKLKVQKVLLNLENPFFADE